MLTILQSFDIWSKLKRWKSSISRFLISCPQIKKIIILTCLSSLMPHNEPFLNQIVVCEEKWILYNNWQWPAQCLDWEKAPKHFPRPNLHPKKGSWSLVVCSCSDPLQLSESKGNHYLWEACSANQWNTLKTATPATPVLVHGKVSFLHSKTWSKVTQCAVLC